MLSVYKINFINHYYYVNEVSKLVFTNNLSKSYQKYTSVATKRDIFFFRKGVVHHGLVLIITEIYALNIHCWMKLSWDCSL